MRKLGISFVLGLVTVVSAVQTPGAAVGARGATVLVAALLPRPGGNPLGLARLETSGGRQRWSHASTRWERNAEGGRCWPGSRGCG
jgi:hypothetical protein